MPKMQVFRHLDISEYLRACSDSVGNFNDFLIGIFATQQAGGYSTQKF